MNERTSGGNLGIGSDGLTDSDQVVELWEQAGVQWRITSWPTENGVWFELRHLHILHKGVKDGPPLVNWEHVWPDGHLGDGIMRPNYMAGHLWQTDGAMRFVPTRLLFQRWRKPFATRVQEAFAWLKGIADLYEARCALRCDLLAEIETALAERSASLQRGLSDPVGRPS